MGKTHSAGNIREYLALGKDGLAKGNYYENSSALLRQGGQICVCSLHRVSGHRARWRNVPR